jgi:UDP-N-acetylglucosamine--dolichyl-phosphate N-acetylglucosaminephosphotransferase
MFGRPESQGLVCAAVYILLLMLFIPFAFTDAIFHAQGKDKSSEGISVVQFPHYQVCPQIINCNES